MCAEGDGRSDARPGPNGDSQYFAADPTVQSAPRTIEVVVPGAAFTLETDRGVFSHGRLDTGTGLLLRQDLPLPESGHLLDLGCGAGPIALTMAQRAPHASVWAIDVNQRARRLCARNAERNGSANIRVAAPDEVPDDVRFSAIWSNPPVRIGKSALHTLLDVWLDRLTPSATAVLVVGRHLGADSLQRWLSAGRRPVRRIAAKAGYRLLEIGPR